MVKREVKRCLLLLYISLGMKSLKPCGKCVKTFKKLADDNKVSIINDISRKIEEAKNMHEKMSTQIKLLNERINSLKADQNELDLVLLNFEQKSAQIEAETMVLKRAILSYS